MGWFSKALYRETDTVSTAAELEGCFSGIGFTFEKDEFFQEPGQLFDKHVLVERWKITREGFTLTAIWDGKVVTFLQKIDSREEPSFHAYQQFHLRGRYFVMTYGGPDHTLIIKHTLFMSIECPVVSASIERVLGFWASDLDPLGILAKGQGGPRHA